MSSGDRIGLGPGTGGLASTGLVIAGTAIATVVLSWFLRTYLWPAQPSIVRSPLRTLLPTLSPEEFAKLEYKPDNFPGARDVETPVRPTRVLLLRFPD